MLLAIAGLCAGILTTLSGLGGGILLVLLLSLTSDPKTALAATTPALLVGNLHRLWVFRHDVDRRIARAVAVGAFPGSLLGGALLESLPHAAVAWLMVATTSLVVLRAAVRSPWTPPRWAISPAAFVVGAIAATSGGAGALSAPLLLSTGLTGAPYVATSAAAAVAMHLGRVVSYGAVGLFTAATLRTAAVLTVTILLGNHAGTKIRPYLGARATHALELATLTAAAALSLGGVTR